MAKIVAVPSAHCQSHPSAPPRSALAQAAESKCEVLLHDPGSPRRLGFSYVVTTDEGESEKLSPLGSPPTGAFKLLSSETWGGCDFGLKSLQGSSLLVDQRISPRLGLGGRTNWPLRRKKLLLLHIGRLRRSPISSLPTTGDEAGKWSWGKRTSMQASMDETLPHVPVFHSRLAATAQSVEVWWWASQGAGDGRVGERGPHRKGDAPVIRKLLSARRCHPFSSSCPHRTHGHHRPFTPFSWRFYQPKSRRALDHSFSKLDAFLQEPKHRANSHSLISLVSTVLVRLSSKKND